MFALWYFARACEPIGERQVIVTFPVAAIAIETYISIALPSNRVRLQDVRKTRFELWRKTNHRNFSFRQINPEAFSCEISHMKYKKNQVQWSF